MRRSRSVKAYQVPDENPGADEGLNLLRGTLVLPAIQSIELPRDYSRTEQAIAKRWAVKGGVRGSFGPRVERPGGSGVSSDRSIRALTSVDGGLGVGTFKPVTY